MRQRIKQTGVATAARALARIAQSRSGHAEYCPDTAEALDSRIVSALRLRPRIRYRMERPWRNDAIVTI
jgi:hypothetical protein